VAQDGAITVPYVGRISVVGKLPAEVEGVIEAGLRGKGGRAPSARHRAAQHRQYVSIGGEVATGARFP